MQKILCIETSGPHCSVCLSEGDEILSERVAEGVNQHSTVLHDFIEEVIVEGEIEKSQLSAIAFSSGPGSYTGLRIGLSAAKGLAYALDIPILEVSTLKMLAYQAKNQINIEQEGKGNQVFVPMIDAGRMEVYYAVYGEDLKEMQSPQSGILSEVFFKDLSEMATGSENKIHFCGNGSAKGVSLVNGMKENIIWVQKIKHSARFLVPIARNLINNNQFADLAYCTPNYVKRYIPGRSKK